LVDVLCEAGSLVAVLDFELVDQQAFELLTLLNVKESLSAGIACA
jgi:hypothetical protein